MFLLGPNELRILIFLNGLQEVIVRERRNLLNPYNGHVLIKILLHFVSATPSHSASRSKTTPNKLEQSLFYLEPPEIQTVSPRKLC